MGNETLIDDPTVAPTTAPTPAPTQPAGTTPPPKKSSGFGSGKSGKSGSAGFMPAFNEAILNTAHYALFDRFMRKHPVVTIGNGVFFASDMAYEMFGDVITDVLPQSFKDLVEPEPTDSFISAGDFADAWKALPIVTIKRLIMKMWKNRSFGDGFLKDTGVAFAAISAANIVGRQISTRITK